MRLLGGEVSRRQCADVEHADELAGRDHGNAEHRRDAPGHEDRVDDRCLVDVIDRDWPALGGHTPREALSERYADRLMYLLLDASGGRGDEIAGRLVQQEYRGRVNR